MNDNATEKPASGSGPSAPADRSARASKSPAPPREVHEVTFVSYPKLIFIWPLIVFGFVCWPVAGWIAPDGIDPGSISAGLEALAWAYLWVIVIVLLTLGVDVDRNQAVFWFVLIAAIWLLGAWLQSARQFTLFGDIYRWFNSLNLQYDRDFALALSIVLSVPFVVMLVYARLNDRWRITHNEFEHYSFGRLDDSLGRGAKTIRTSYPDVFEMLLGLAGTLTVYNATGTRELRRIPHVFLLPLVRRKLDRILERTAVTAAVIDDDEDDEESEL